MLLLWTLPAFAGKVADTTSWDWYPGDGHVHSAYSSSDGSYSYPWLVPDEYKPRVFSECWPFRGVYWCASLDHDLPGPDEQAERSAALGLRWMIFTDHEDMLTASSWAAQVAEVAALTSPKPSLTGVQEEMGTSIDVTDGESILGHFLVYDSTEYSEWHEGTPWDADESYAELLTRIYDEQGAFGAVAHARYSVFPWGSSVWGGPGTETSNAAVGERSLTDRVGWEVITPGEGVNEGLLEDYQTLLKNEGNHFIFPMANSDAHWPSGLGDVEGDDEGKITAITYVLAPGAAAIADITEGLSLGQTVASTGGFGTIQLSVNGGGDHEVGDFVETLTSDTLTIRSKWKGNGTHPNRIRVYDRDSSLESPVWEANLSLEDEGNMDLFEVQPSKDTYYWARITFDDGSEAITAPVWVTVSDALSFGSGLDTVLIIDSSGSMSTNDPDRTRVAAAQAFVDLVGDGDYVGVVDFDDSASTLGELTAAAGNRTLIKDWIEQVDQDGGTDLGAGLRAGYSVLEGGYSGHRKVAVFLTDGEGDYSDEALDYAAMGWPIYTIGLGPNTDADLLDDIADQSGGVYYEVDSATEAASALLEVYAGICIDLSGFEDRGDAEFDLEEGDSDSADAEILSGDALASWLLLWGGSDFDLTLVSPSGVVYDPDAPPAGSSYLTGPTYEVWRVKDPEPGAWTATATAIDVPSGGEVAKLTVGAQTSTTPELWFEEPVGTVSGTVDVKLHAADVEGLTHVWLDIGEDRQELAAPDYAATLDTTTFDDGDLLLFATAEDIDGHAVTASTAFSVLNSPESAPSIEATVEELSLVVGEVGVFDAWATVPDDEQAWARWDFGDGETMDAPYAEHAYAATGDYLAEVRVETAVGLSGSDQVMVHVTEVIEDSGGTTDSPVSEDTDPATPKTETPAEKADSGCGCSAGGSGSGLAVAFVSAALLRRRRGR